MGRNPKNRYKAEGWQLRQQNRTSEGERLNNDVSNNSSLCEQSFYATVVLTALNYDTEFSQLYGVGMFISS